MMHFVKSYFCEDLRVSCTTPLGSCASSSSLPSAIRIMKFQVMPMVVWSLHIICNDVHRYTLYNTCMVFNISVSHYLLQERTIMNDGYFICVQKQNTLNQNVNKHIVRLPCTVLVDHHFHR